MKILAPLIFVGLILLGVFTLANWTALSTPSTLSFVAFHLEAPLGFVLLGILAVFVALFVAYILILRTTMLVEARRYTHELQAQRKLAEQAEASRLSELRSQLDREFAQLRETTEKSRTDLGVRVEGMEQALKSVIEESSRSLSAYIGEVEDKIDRSLGRSAVEK
jgi:mannitol-specific phosphotransferase system IIBC component